MVHGLFVPAQGSRPVDDRTFVALADYQAAVGGWIEFVDLPTFGSTSICVNDNGIALRLKPNQRATDLWWLHTPRARGRAYLFGDAVLVGFDEGGGEPTDLSQVIRQSLLEGEGHVAVIAYDASGWWRSNSTDPDYWSAAHRALAMGSLDPAITALGVLGLDAAAGLRTFGPARP